jgi:chromosome segregation ATPase
MLHATKEVQAAQERLQAERDRIPPSDGAQRHAEQATIEARLTELHQLELQTRQDTSSFLRQYEELEPHVDQAKSNTSSKNSQYNAVKAKMEELNRSEGNQLAQFGPKCTAVYQRVVAMRDKWRGPVVGPIGASIKVVEGKEHLAEIAE